MSEQVYKWKSSPLSCLDVEEINALLKQLSSGAGPICIDHLIQLIKTGYLLLAWDKTVLRSDGEMKIIGMATLIPCFILAKPFGLIEDVVVDEAYQGRGIGKGLNLCLIEKARELGLKRVQLTSRPSRKPANKMYKRLGYKLVAHARYPHAKYPNDTNLYRLELA